MVGLRAQMSGPRNKATKAGVTARAPGMITMRGMVFLGEDFKKDGEKAECVHQLCWPVMYCSIELL
jgi:hypothetical protein